MAIEILETYAFDDVGLFGIPLTPPPKFISATEQANEAEPLKLYRLSGWVVFPAGGEYQIWFSANSGGSYRLNGLNQANSSDGMSSVINFATTSPQVVRVDATYATYAAGQVGCVQFAIRDTEGNIIYSPEAEDFTAYTVDNFDEFIDEALLPAKPDTPGGPPGPPPPEPWDGTLTQVYETLRYRATDALPGYALHLTPDPRIVDEVYRYNYKIAKWLIFPTGGFYQFTIAIGFGAVVFISIDGETIYYGVLEGVGTVDLFVPFPKTARLDIHWQPSVVGAGSVLEIYAGYILRDAAGRTIDEGRAVDFVGAIMFDASNIPDEDLTNTPTVPPAEEDLRTKLQVFGVKPNWRDGLSYYQDYMTDVQSSEVGWELRASVRIEPRERVEFTASQWGANRQKRINELAAQGSAEVMLPLWWTATAITQQATPGQTRLYGRFNRWEFLSGSVIAIAEGGTAERAIIASVADTWIDLVAPLKYGHQKRTKVTAARVSRFIGQTSYRMRSSTVSENTSEIEVLERYTAPAKWYVNPDFDDKTDSGLPVFTIIPNMPGDLEVTQDRVRYILDNDISAPYLVEPTGHDQFMFRQTYHCANVEQINDMAAQISATAGRLRTFLIPTYNDDLTVSKTHSGSSEWIMTEDTGQLGNSQPLTKYIMVTFTDGKRYLRQVVQMQQIGLSVRLLLNNPIPQHAASDIVSICYVWESRLDTDVIEFKYLTDSVCTVALTYKAFRNTISTSGVVTVLPTTAPQYLIGDL